MVKAGLGAGWAGPGFGSSVASGDGAGGCLSATAVEPASGGLSIVIGAEVIGAEAALSVGFAVSAGTEVAGVAAGDAFPEVGGVAAFEAGGVEAGTGCVAGCEAAGGCELAAGEDEFASLDGSLEAVGF